MTQSEKWKAVFSGVLLTLLIQLIPSSAVSDPEVYDAVDPSLIDTPELAAPNLLPRSLPSDIKTANGSIEAPKKKKISKAKQAPKTAVSKNSRKKTPDTSSIKELTKLRKENRDLKSKLQLLPRIAKRERNRCERPRAPYSPDLYDRSFEVVPDDRALELADRLQLVSELIVKHQRAYDYRTMTDSQLEKILNDLDGQNQNQSAPLLFDWN